MKQRTYERYKELVAHLKPIANIKLQDLQSVQVQQFYQNIPLSPCSVHKVHKVLKELYVKAYVLDIVSKDIMKAVVPPRFEQKEIEIFSTKEIELILQTAHDYRGLERYYPIILLAATTGMRLGEVLGLRWCDVFFVTSEIYIRKSLQNSAENGLFLETPKTKAGKRKITLTDDVINVLKEIKKAVPSIDIKQEQQCFLSKRRKPIFPYNVERA